jgi:hypothetical protein
MRRAAGDDDLGIDTPRVEDGRDVEQEKRDEKDRSPRPAQPSRGQERGRGEQQHIGRKAEHPPAQGPLYRLLSTGVVVEPFFRHAMDLPLFWADLFPTPNLAQENRPINRPAEEGDWRTAPTGAARIHGGSIKARSASEALSGPPHLRFRALIYVVQRAPSSMAAPFAGFRLASVRRNG